MTCSSPPGSTTIAVRFDITPVELDSGASQVNLEFDGTSVTYAHGPARSTQITWPGPNGMTNVRLVFNPPPRGATGVISETGPWAMFRLFGRGTLQQAGFAGALSADASTRRAQRCVRDPRGLGHANPFAPGVLQDFRCPVGQRLARRCRRCSPMRLPACSASCRRAETSCAENLPRDFTDSWDGWWQRGLAETQARWRDEWYDAWLEAPVWRFMLPPGLCGKNGMLGLWLPSVDKVGRYSPLTIAAAAPL